MKKVERNKYRKKVNTNDRAVKLYLKNCPPEPVSEFVNALDDCLFIEKYKRIDKSELGYKDKCNEEFRTYSSQFIFSPKSMPTFSNGVQIRSIDNVKMYLHTNSGYKDCPKIFNPLN